MSTPTLRVLSYGGGTQSAALALMSAAGDLPKLDAVIFADTQGELPETYLYADYVWPLIDMQYRRGDTIAWFEKNGHPTPPRSACWFCPNARNPRWRQLKDEHPDLFERACELDETIRNGGGFNARGNVPFAGTMFLHDSLIPLRSADLRDRWERDVDGGQGDLFDGAALANDCESGVCFT